MINYGSSIQESKARKAFDAYVRARKQGTSFEDVMRGIKAYLKYIRFEKIKPEFIKQGSTYFSQQAWQDDWRPRGAYGVILTDAEDDELDGIL